MLLIVWFCIVDASRVEVIEDMELLLKVWFWIILGWISEIIVVYVLLLRIWFWIVAIEMLLLVWTFGYWISEITVAIKL